MNDEASPHDEDVPDESGRRWAFLPLTRGDDEEGRTERLVQQFAQQWASVRAERRAEPPAVTTGTSNFSRAQVPWGLDLAAAWSWRLIAIMVAMLGLLWGLRFFAVITIPLSIALLLSALANPLVNRLRRTGLPRGPSAGIVLVLGMGVLGLLLTYVGQQVALGAADLADSVVEGLGQVRESLRTGPFGVSDSQLDGWIKDVQGTISASSEEGGTVNRVTEVGSAVGHGVAGFFIVLFSTYFFMADGDRIWAWLVRVAPRAARERMDASGRVAWVSLTQFVRATVLVALVDAVGVMIVAGMIGIPFVIAIGVLVFLGAFVPLVGATVAGSVAILVALVDQGPVAALLMLGGVVLVQQLEGHVLQPFLMGRFVSLHPLGVIVAIAAGILVAGIAGALIAVPLAAAGNAVVQHLARYTTVGEPDAEEALEVDLAMDGGPEVPVPPNDGPFTGPSPEAPAAPAGPRLRSDDDE